MSGASDYTGLLAALILAAAPAAASPPSVYHSAGDDGVDPGGSVSVAAPATVHLYLDGGAIASSGAACAPGGDGDEVCGWKLHLEGQNGLDLVSFTPTGDVVFGLDGNTLHSTGGNPSTGTLGPSKIGDLVVDGIEGGELALLASYSVGAGQTLGALAPATVVVIPEPGGPVMLVSGLVLLRALRRRSSSRR
jgi:hypothetical protein